MLDAAVCAGMELGESVISLSALTDPHRLLIVKVHVRFSRLVVMRRVPCVPRLFEASSEDRVSQGDDGVGAIAGPRQAGALEPAAHDPLASRPDVTPFAGPGGREKHDRCLEMMAACARIGSAWRPPARFDETKKQRPQDHDQHDPHDVMDRNEGGRAAEGKRDQAHLGESAGGERKKQGRP